MCKKENRITSVYSGLSEEQENDSREVSHVNEDDIYCRCKRISFPDEDADNSVFGEDVCVSPDDIGNLFDDDGGCACVRHKGRLISCQGNVIPPTKAKKAFVIY